MSTLQKLKAYFGMVPADDLDDYDYEPETEYRRGYSHRDSHRGGYASDQDYGRSADYPEYSNGRRAYGSSRGGYAGEPTDFELADRPDRTDTRDSRSERSRSAWAGASGASTPQVHGSLAVETRREPVARLRPTADLSTMTAPAAPSASTSGYPLGRVITLHPTSYNEARTIGEHYRDGTPVIMNLTELDDAAAKRLVDFAAGLAFALRGSMDKVTNKVFLISPPNVDPSAEDRRRIAEGGFATRR